MLLYFKFVLLKRIILLMIISSIVYVYKKLDQEKPHYRILDENLVDWKYYLPEEIDFPLGFGLTLHSDVTQFHQLFNQIYQPFHIYCIHVSLNSKQDAHELVKNLSRKYNNVIIPKKVKKEDYNGYEILKGELRCMEELLNQKKFDWKYFINFTGQDWPLKVNLELIRILKALKGANLVEKLKLNPGRVPSTLGPPPHGIKLWKGAKSVFVIKAFVRFALRDKRALDLLNFLRYTEIPEETYFSTLNHDHSLRAPGGYSGNTHTDNKIYPYLNRYKLWDGADVCHGVFVKGICIFSMKDVPAMIDVNNMKLIANKFIVDINPDVLNHMRQWLSYRDKIVYSNPKINPFINVTFYSQLSVVRQHY